MQAPILSATLYRPHHGPLTPRSWVECMNLTLGWISILAGTVSGGITGLFFWREDWLGGYGSWRRRMVRLGHIAFFGLGFLNVIFAVSIVPRVAAPGGRLMAWASALLVLGNLTMSPVCYLSAWQMRYRHLFPIPALSAMAGVALAVGALLGA